MASETHYEYLCGHCSPPNQHFVGNPVPDIEYSTIQSKCFLCEVIEEGEAIGKKAKEFKLRLEALAERVELCKKALEKHTREIEEGRRLRDQEDERRRQEAISVLEQERILQAMARLQNDPDTLRQSKERCLMLERQFIDA
ncbi:hypothetical protein MMC12_000977 [Toensbergia leucococca]|nr:hypothetical protein [Toensbergia leucococca]